MFVLIFLYPIALFRDRLLAQLSNFLQLHRYFTLIKVKALALDKFRFPSAKDSSPYYGRHYEKQNKKPPISCWLYGCKIISDMSPVSTKPVTQMNANLLMWTILIEKWRSVL